MSKNNDLDLELDTNFAPEKSRSIKPLLLALVLLGTIGSTVGYFMLGGDTSENVQKVVVEEAKIVPSDIKTHQFYYHKFENDLVTKLLAEDSQPHYIRLRISLMHDEPSLNDLISQSEPIMLNDILEYIGAIKYEDTDTLVYKKRMKSDILNIVNTILKEHGSQHVVSKILFTDFIIE